MRATYLKTILKATSLGAMILLGAALASAQVTVNLSANRQTTTLSDGNTVSMWGWFCGNAGGTTPSTSVATGITCSAMTGTVQTAGGTAWQPPLITVSSTAAAAGITIVLTNNLPVETSLVILGQTGGGLGGPVREAAPRTHDPQTEVTWTTNIGGTFTPPAQGERVRSFVPEAAAATSAAAGTQSYTYTNLKPGTYLIESGTYPSIQGPMGLYGVLVVTTAPVAGATSLTPGTAYPGITYDADVPVLVSEIDPVQNGAVEKFVETVAGCPTTTPGTGACTGTVTPTAATTKWTPACSTQGPAGTQNTCYPPAVNYTPLYYLVDGVSYSKDAPVASLLAVPSAASTGNVLLRFVNAGLHLHMPSVNNLSMQLIAEDGNVLPEVALGLSKAKTMCTTPQVLAQIATASTSTTAATCVLTKVQNEIYLPAGKVHDVMVSPANNATATAAASAYSAATYQIFDRELSLSSNASQHDSGMQATLMVGTTTLTPAAAVANADTYYCAPGVTLTVSDPSKGVRGNDVNVYGVALLPVTIPPTHTLASFGGGSLTLNADGTFVYTQPATATTCGGTFSYYGNGNTTVTATVTISVSPTVTAGNRPTANAVTYNSNVATVLKVSRPGALANDTDPNNYPLTAALPGVTPRPDGSTTGTYGNLTVTLFPDGSFTAVRSGCPLPPTPATPTNCASASPTFPHIAVNSEKIASPASANVTVNFPAASGVVVHVQDGKDHTAVTDYKWLIEQDRSFQINPETQVNTGTGVVASLATNFHTSYMPVVAAGCTGAQSCERDQTVYDPTTGSHVPAVCEGGGICIPAPAGSTLPTSTVDQATLPTLDSFGRPIYYYLSVLPGDAANAFNTGNSSTPNSTNCVAGSTPTGQSLGSICGHTMGGAPIIPTCTTSTTGTTTCTLPTTVTVNVEPNPLPTAEVTVYVWEDDNELNGEVDSELQLPADEGKQAEPGLGDFQLELWDTGGQSGDFIGQMTYDMFNEPLTNAYNGTVDPLTGKDACPISNQQGQDPNTLSSSGGTIPVGVILVCPEFESDGVTKSPLVGRALIKNLMPGKFSIIAHPGAAREAKGEEWVQTNTLDGGHYLDSFIRSGEPGYFQEYGPAGYHVFLGFANPRIINAHRDAVCVGTLDISGEPRVGGSIPCNNSIKGQITNLHISRPPDERLYDSGVAAEGSSVNRATFAHTTCFVSLGVLDAPDLAFTKCDKDGNFSFTGIPDGQYSVTVFDQWLDQLMFEKEVTVAKGQSLDIGTYPVFSWTSQIWTNTYMDLNQNGTPDAGEPGLIQVPVRIRFRNGRFVNSLATDINGLAHFNETIPLFNWYTIESDTTRFKGTGVHVVDDAGGPLDATGPYAGQLNSTETFSLPTGLRVPGSVYCPQGDAACLHTNYATTHGAGGGAAPPATTSCNPDATPAVLTGCISTGRIDSGTVTVEGFQAFAGQPISLDWGKTPYVPGENGGIRGHVTYASTRPFDDPQMLFQNLWEPLVPGVTMNLYQENTGPDGTTTLTLVDTTKTASWDDWAQGFYTPTGSTTSVPNMNCPGQDTADPYLKYTLTGSANYLNPTTGLPSSSQYKCYDGMHAFNQIEPAPYDGLYHFPSSFCAANPLGTIPGTTIKCVTQANPANNPLTLTTLNPNNLVFPAVMPAGKYVVEAVTPPGYEIVKEEDKNILIGDAFIGYVTQQFGGIVNIFIVPDQATINANPSYTGPSTASNQFSFTNGIPSGNIGNPTNDMGRTTFGSFGPGGLIVQNTPCVGQLRIVPDFMSASPEGGEVAPFAGSLRSLCDRKEVTLEDQMEASAEFYIWTKTPASTHFTGFILDDFSSEFDPNSPDFGEKFAVPNLPVSIKDYNGVEISRTYSDQWGIYNGLTFSTWQVNPPNPAGYAPGMLITCMNDPGPILDTRPGSPTLGQMIQDPGFNPQYSDFCYENPFMPGDTTYLDTPVVPVAAFAEGYNPPDCSYPDATPAILRVDSSDSTFGPWVSGTGPSHTLTITALGDQVVPNNAYSGPAATTSPFNKKSITRHYGFGSGGTVTITGPPPGCSHLNFQPCPYQGSPVQLGGVTWSDSKITAFVPAGVCPPPQLALGGCSGQLVITRSDNGRQSVDTVTVTVGGKTPTPVNGENTANNAIQSAIDAANPGDLIMVNGTFAAVNPAAPTACAGVTKVTATLSANCKPEPATYPEMLVMWKPVRLQGVGAASVKIDANPNVGQDKLNLWRAKVACVLGIGVNQGTIGANGIGVNGYQLPPGCKQGNTATDPTAMLNSTCVATVQSVANPPACGADSPLPDEASQLGAQSWNLDIGAFEVFVEPTLMAAEEGPGITAVGFDGTSLLPAGLVPPQLLPPLIPLLCAFNLFGFDHPANFYCAQSRVDGMSFTNSQAGGGIYAHGWNHNIEVSNNRVFSNGGTITGGIRFGQIEVPTSATDAFGNVVPSSFSVNAKVHNNSVTHNVSFGDEFNVDTPAAGGGVAFCTGSDLYHFNFNWVCGNLSTSNGGGVDHRGLSFNGDISHNTIIFNQAFNQTLDTHGGGIIVEGEPNPGNCAGPPQDLGCPIALSDGSGNVSIDSNVIIGNIAEGGSGGGIRLENVNGSDVTRNPNNNPPFPLNPANGQQWSPWWKISITNNVIANNVASWEGGGISLFNAVNATITGNAVISNDATATAGVLFDTAGANQSATGTPPPGPGSTAGSTTCGIAQCNPANPVVQSNFEPAGLATELNAPPLVTAFGASVNCPSGAGTNCTAFSNPVIKNDIFWQNRSFKIQVGTNPTPGLQNVITLTPQLTQTATGACPAGANYWDIGLDGDTGIAGGNPGGYRLSPTGSVVGTGSYAGNTTAASHQQFYCNGSRVPPEIVASICAANANNPACSSGGNGGASVPPGIPDIDPFFPLFTLNPDATVDEGNNWINLRYGPLSLSNTATPPATPGTNQAPLGQYLLPLQVAPNPLAFGTVAVATTATVTVTNPSLNPALTGGFSVTVAGTGFSRPAAALGGTCGAATTVVSGSSCTIRVTFTPPATAAHGAPFTGTLTIADNGGNSPQVVALTATKR